MIISRFLIAHNIQKNTQVKLYILIHSSTCISNFMLPSCRPKFGKTPHIT